MRAGSDESAIPPLQKAVELDPTLAQAHMRLTRLTAAFGTDPRPSLARTLQLRGRLTQRDQDLFDALRPFSEGETHDVGAALAAIDRLAEKYPDDAEIAYSRGDAYLQAGPLEEVIRSSRRALDLDPEYGDAASLLDLALGRAGRFDEERALAELCVSRWSSIDCGINDLQARSYEGDVPGTRAMAERALRIDPTALNLALYEASALVASGEPVAAARAVLDPVRARLPAYAAKARIDAPLSALAGDLGTAARLLAEALDQSPRTQAARGQIVRDLIEMDEEMGRRDDARRVAQVYRSESAGYTKTEGIDWATFVLHELVVTGAVPREQLDRLHDDRLRAVDAGPTGNSAEQWATHFGSLATTREDALAAIGALSVYGTPAFLGYHFNGGLVGRARFLAGDVQGALPDLQRGAREVRALFGPRDLVRARLLLGEALEAKGDRADACEAFEAVLDRWGSANPRSVSADEARKHRAAISCPARR
jgi:serine/threonine-protein kinase